MREDFLFSDSSDEDLLRDVSALATRERQSTARLVAALAELDARRLYLGVGCSSLFTYCTQVLHLSEHAAYGRIEAARAARRFPVILDRLADGSVHLTAICLLAPLLTADNHVALLDAARHTSKRDVEHLVASVRPQPPVPVVIRKLPAPSLRVPSADSAPNDQLGCASSVSDMPQAPGTEGDSVDELHSPAEFGHPATAVISRPPRPPVIVPLAPEQYKVQFTASRETHDKLRRAQDLLRHVIPTGDPAAIIDRALTLLLADLEKTRLAAVRQPRDPRPPSPGSRHVPAAVKREVWARDGGLCAFVGWCGRCTERGLLEFHHVVPYAAGGATDADNLQLRCRAHNAYEAEQWFGPLAVREESVLYALVKGVDSLSVSG